MIRRCWKCGSPDHDACISADPVDADPYVTTRLAEAADRAAKAEARADRAEALYAGLIPKYQGLTAFYDEHVGTPCEQVRHEAQVAALTRKLDEARGVLLCAEWRGGEHGRRNCPWCRVAYLQSHGPNCRFAAVIAPETGKETP